MTRLCVLFGLLSVAFAARAQTVICFGDSLTAGVGAPKGSSYPDFLERDLQAAGYRATVVNEGIGGDTAEHALSRLQPILAAHPALVILELGANDALGNRPMPDIVHDLDTLLETFHRAKIPVVLAGLDARRYLRSDTPPRLVSPEMRQLFTLNNKLARQYHVPLVPFLLKGVYGDPELMSGDQMHPNGAGYERVAKTVLPYVEAALKTSAKKRKETDRRASPSQPAVDAPLH